MPQKKFSYHLSNGKTLDLEGDEPPSDDEVEAIAKEQGVQLQVADAPTPLVKKEPTRQQVEDALHPPEPELGVERGIGPANPSAERRHQEDYNARWGIPGSSIPAVDPISKVGRDWLKTPLTEAPSRFAKQVSQYIDPEQSPTGPRAHLSAFVESLGNIGSQATSPGEIATNVLTAGTTANLLRRAGKVGKLGKIADDVANMHGPHEQPYGPEQWPIGPREHPNIKVIDDQLVDTSIDPNLQGGMGDPMLAGSTPSPHLPEIADDIATGSKVKPHYRLENGKLVPAERLPDLEELTTAHEPIASEPDTTGVDFESPVAEQQLPESWQTLAERPKSVQQILNEAAIMKRRQLIEQRNALKAAPEQIANVEEMKYVEDSLPPKEEPQVGKVRQRLRELYDKDQTKPSSLTMEDIEEGRRLTAHLNDPLAKYNDAENIFPEDTAAYHKAKSEGEAQLRDEGFDVSGEGQVTKKSPSEVAANAELERSVGGKKELDKIKLDNILSDLEKITNKHKPVTGTPPGEFTPPPPTADVRPLPTEPLPPPNVKSQAAPRPPVAPLTPPDTPRPKLEKGLAGAKPRYNMGSNLYEPVFENDLDKALFIIAQKTPSKRNADYLAFAMKHTGLDEKAVLKLAETTKQTIKRQLQGGQSGQVKIPSINDAIQAAPTSPVSAGASGPPKVPPTVPPNVPPTGGPPPVPPTPQIPAAIAAANKKAQAAMMVRAPEKESILRKVLDFNRTLLTAYDMSAPLRQGLGMITHPEFWTSLDDMFKAVGSKRGFETVMKSIEDDPSGYFKRGVSPAGVQLPSYAERVGLAVHDIPEEIFRGAGGRAAEKYLPGVKQSNRAYNGYIAKLRADGFKRLVKEATAAGKDPENDVVLGKKIADFINTATGRGSLGKLEPVVKQLSDVFFAPKLMASRLQTYNNALNPYKLGLLGKTQVDPMLRREALRSLFGVVMSGGMISGMSKAVGADVSLDPRSTDFMKIKIGNSRYDPFGGYQQYAVNTAKFITGTSISSKDPSKRVDLTAGRFGQDTRQDIASRFFTNKLAPVPSLIWSWMGGKEFDGTPFEVKKAVLTRTVPIFMQDMYELLQEDPNLVPAHIKALFTTGSLFGGGIQTYGR